MARNNWANIRLSVSVHPNTSKGQGALCADWRLYAKAPNENWTEGSTVAMGSEDVAGVQWPLTRDDALAIMTEVLMGVRWEEPPF